MKVKVYSVKNALIVAVFCSLFVLPSIAGAAKPDDPGKPPHAGGPEGPASPDKPGKPDDKPDKPGKPN